MGCPKKAKKISSLIFSIMIMVALMLRERRSQDIPGICRSLQFPFVPRLRPNRTQTPRPNYDENAHPWPVLLSMASWKAAWKTFFYQDFLGNYRIQWVLNHSFVSYIARIVNTIVTNKLRWWCWKNVFLVSFSKHFQNNAETFKVYFRNWSEFQTISRVWPSICAWFSLLLSQTDGWQELVFKPSPTLASHFKAGIF